MFQAQLAQKTTLLNDTKLKEQEFREQVRKYFEKGGVSFILRAQKISRVISYDMTIKGSCISQGMAPGAFGGSTARYKKLD